MFADYLGEIPAETNRQEGQERQGGQGGGGLSWSSWFSHWGWVDTDVFLGAKREEKRREEMRAVSREAKRGGYRRDANRCHLGRVETPCGAK